MADFTDQSGWSWERASVCIADAFGPYDALVARDGDRLVSWNGAVWPRFTREVAARAAADMASDDMGPDGVRFRWTPSGALVEFRRAGGEWAEDGSWSDVGASWGAQDVTSPDADGLYPFGAGAFVWSLCSDVEG